MSQTSLPLIFVPCPVAESGFSGWALQFRRIAARNCADAEFRFLYGSEFEPKPEGLFSRVLASLAFAFRCRGIILRETEQVTVLFPSFFLPNVLIALILPRHIRYVLQISGNELDCGNPLGYLLRMAMVTRANYVIALNTEQCRQLDQLGIPAKRRHLIPVSIGPDFRPPTQLERDASREDLGLSSDDWVVGSVGLLSERKQQRALVTAVARLNRPDALVVLCGPESGGSEADFNYAKACQADARRLGVRLIMTGRREDVRAILWALDVFVLPSLSEGMPNAMLEALACGLPCVGSDIPGIRHLLMDGQQGRLFEVGDIVGLAEGLVNAKTPDNRAEMIAELRAEVVDAQMMRLLT